MDDWINWNNEAQYKNTSHGDENGTPKVHSMEVTFDDATGYLLGIDSILHNRTTRQKFDSLFINSYNTLLGGRERILLGERKITLLGERQSTRIE